ncbi:STAS domain-containing protein [bacterium]|nr:STAS domain-containing protein [bacterium]
MCSDKQKPVGSIVPGSIQTGDVENVSVISVNGYYEKELGAQVFQQADALLQKGKINFIIDFSACTLINSPGVASLLTLTMKVSQDFRGRVFIVGLDALKTKVLNMAGVSSLAEIQPTLSDGLKKVKESNS